MSLRDVAAEGDELKTLVRLRDDLAAQLDCCESQRDYAALSLRFMDLLERITEVEKRQPAVKGTAVDEFSKRLAAKVSGQGSPKPARGRKSS